MSEKLSVSVQLTDEQIKTALEDIINDAKGFEVIQPRGMDHVDYLILELDEQDPAKTLSHIEGNLKGFPQTTIFLTCKHIDAPTLLTAFRIGVKEFISQPLNREEIHQVLARAKEQPREPAEPVRVQKQKARVISILGGKAGVGVTTFAVNLGVSMQNLGKSVVVVDLNFHSGDLPVFLDLEPSRCIFDVARNLSRLDDAFMLSCLTKHSTGVSILSLDEMRPPKIGDKKTDKLTASMILAALQSLEGLFDYILIDCGAVLDERMVKIFEHSAMLFILYNLRLPVIKKTQRLLQMLDEVGYSREKRKLVLNAFDAEAEALLLETESIFGGKVFMKLAEDHSSADTAVNSGIPLVIGAPKTSVGVSFQNLACFLVGQKPPRKKMGNGSIFAALGLADMGGKWASLKDKLTTPKAKPNVLQETKT